MIASSPCGDCVNCSFFLKLFNSGSGLQLHTQSSPGERNGKFGQNVQVHLGFIINVSSSAHD